MTRKTEKSVSPTTTKTNGATEVTRVSSAASTGGAGTFFEQHVAAYWLAQLLVGGIPPILLDCTITELCLQTEHLEWHTDDFLVIGQNGAGNNRKLAGQVKRTFTISATDEECRKAIQDFWKDFKNTSQFSSATDRLVLVTLRGTNVLLEHFSGLLDCARAARDEVEFEHRLKTPGVLSATSKRYCEEIQTIIGETEGKIITAANVWPFLRVLHVLSLDLNSSTRQTESAIKSLLAYTTNEQDALGIAEVSWNALLAEVGDGMPNARRFRRDDLPQTIRQRHSSIGGTEHAALCALRDHSRLILGGIRTTIGKEFHLDRSQLVRQVIEKLESTQIVLVSGVAGSGKSAVAKNVLTILADDYFTFSFRAEEFAHSHFDETLQSSQIPVNAAMLGAILAGQDRKVLLVESVERLLEKSTRDAFTDLLTLVVKDKSWCLVMTCRDYSVDLVRTGLLEFAGVGHSVIPVPPLDDEELDEVKVAHPMMARPLANVALRRLMRTPYILDKAVQIPWSEEDSLPQNEQEFRSRFWREIVCVEHYAVSGMPRRRGDTFVTIALRRAQALDLYARCGDLDREAITALQRDSLVSFSPQSDVLVAPAHDVLEDWAILQWIGEQYAIYEGSIREISDAIGTHPDVRRTHRKWVTELVVRDPGAADKLFRDAVRERGLPAQFLDDTLISLLRSPASAEFLERHSAKLFENDKQLLRRVIHLLRVACVTTPAWLETTTAVASIVNVPDSPAWACVLRLVQTHLELFAQEDYLLLLGFIEDWAEGVSWQTPYPEGSESVASIAHWLLPNFDNYRSNDQRERTLRVIAKIPNADKERFVALLQRDSDNEERDRATEDFRKIIFEGIEGIAAARDIPDVFVSAARDYLMCSETDLKRRDWYESSPLELDTLFGLKQGRSYDFFPASAYHGPFLWLLRYHPDKAMSFIIEVFNHSAEWYAHPRVQHRYVESPSEMTLTFADGTSRSQWCNNRLWNLYRGTSVGPHALQSLLMALERWLLGFAEARPSELDNMLLHILQQSDSVALTAVVASVATAYPYASGETLLVLLRAPLCIMLDHHRLASESQAPSKLSGLLLQPHARHRMHEEERKEADARPHRSHDLEVAIFELQLGPFAPRIHEILDRHRAEMPPVEMQDEKDRMWRLAIHRMDLRQYATTENAEPSVALENHTPPKSDQQHIRLDLKVPEPDIKEMIDQKTARFQAMEAKLGLLLWGTKIFDYEEDVTYAATQWQQRLQEAQTSYSECVSNEGYDSSREGPGFVATVCVRDHWEAMSSDEQDWCVNVICSEVAHKGDCWDHIERIQQNRLSADRACAWVLPMLIGKPLSRAQQTRVRQTFVIALTHAINEVRWYAAVGIGKHLWTIDPDLALRCVNVLELEATLLHTGEWIAPVEGEVVTSLRRKFFEANGIPADALQKFDPTQRYEAEANKYILTILSQAPTHPAAIAAFKQLAHTLVKWWDEDDDRRQGQRHERLQRNYETESALTHLLGGFLLHVTTEDAITTIKPIVEVIDHHPDKVHWFLENLVSVENRQPNTPQFWSLWEQFATGVRQASWLAKIDNEHAWGKEMISAIFLGSWWKDTARHWRSLEGYAERIHNLFMDLPASSTVLDNYLRFLYHIGEQSLPEAFIHIAKRLQQGDSWQMLRQGNTVFMLEVSLRRYVYGKPLELKRRNELREAVLLLLDLLVKNGSSAAFRMRDDFVTPIQSD
ncbi:MAG: AAA family ATPase [Anaerolineae bacterium]|nr:AAA family ATPase [Anaerolineae bacterium]